MIDLGPQADEIKHFIAVRCPEVARLPLFVRGKCQVPVHSPARVASRVLAWRTQRASAWDWAGAMAFNALRCPTCPLPDDPGQLAALQATAGRRAWYAAQDAAADAARAMVVRDVLGAGLLAALLAPWQGLERQLSAWVG